MALHLKSNSVLCAGWWTANRKSFFRSNVLGSYKPKTDFFLVGFSVAIINRNRKTDSVFFGRFFFLSHTPITPADLRGNHVMYGQHGHAKPTDTAQLTAAVKNRPKPTDVFGEETKNRLRHFYFRFFATYSSIDPRIRKSLVGTKGSFFGGH